MPRQLVECVPNFSEGRDPAKIDAIVNAILSVPEVALLDRESDADHNRCVLTFVGPPAAVAAAAFKAVEQAVATIEAMKMEAAITSPVAGRVTRVAIPVTQQVDAGDLLVVVD